MIIMLIAGGGALGGLTKRVIGEGFHLPKLDLANGVWTAGWVGQSLSVQSWGIRSCGSYKNVN